MVNLSDKTTSGLFWSAVAQVVRQVLSLAKLVILARLLMPAEFGYYGMVLVFVGLAELFTRVGMDSVIIRKQQLEERHLSSIFWLTAGAAVIAWLAAFGASSLIAGFYSVPLLEKLTPVIALQSFFNTIGILPSSLILREMRFKTFAIADIAAIVVSGVLGIYMAFAGYGAWSLVAHGVALSGVRTVIQWLAHSWRPKLIFDVSALSEAVAFGGNVVGHGFIEYCVANIDDLLISRFLGAGSLGLYSRAYQVMVLPLNLICRIFTKVVYSTLCKLQDDIAKIRETYLECLGLIGLVAFPAMLGLMAVADNLVLVAFGERWMAMVPVLRIFCLVALTQGTVSTTEWVFLARGRADLMFKWSVFSGVVKAACIAGGLKWGICGVAAGYAFASYVILLYHSFAIPGRLIDMSFRQVIANLYSPFMCSLIMAAAVYWGGAYMRVSLPLWGVLLVQIACGAVVYPVMVHVFNLSSYRNLKSRIVNLRQVGKA